MATLMRAVRGVGQGISRTVQEIFFPFGPAKSRRLTAEAKLASVRARTRAGTAEERALLQDHQKRLAEYVDLCKVLEVRALRRQRKIRYFHMAFTGGVLTYMAYAMIQKD